MRGCGPRPLGPDAGAGRAGRRLSEQVAQSGRRLRCGSRRSDPVREPSAVTLTSSCVSPCCALPPGERCSAAPPRTGSLGHRRCHPRRSSRSFRLSLGMRTRPSAPKCVIMRGPSPPPHTTTTTTTIPASVAADRAYGHALGVVLLQMLPRCSQATKLTVALHRWIGAPISNFLTGLKPVQVRWRRGRAQIVSTSVLTELCRGLKGAKPGEFVPADERA